MAASMRIYEWSFRTGIFKRLSPFTGQMRSRYPYQTASLFTSNLYSTKPVKRGRKKDRESEGLVDSVVTNKQWRDDTTRKEPPLSIDHFFHQKDNKQPPNAKVLKVSIIGKTNVGKSTLLNKLMNWKVSAVSQHVHTTRKKTVGTLTKDEKQIIFLDTPGIVSEEKKKRLRLENSLFKDPHASVHESDLIAVVIDCSDRWFWTNVHIDPEILKALHINSDKRSILILNKLDANKDKGILLKFIRKLTKGTVGGKTMDVRPVKTKKKKFTVNLPVLFDKMDQERERRRKESLEAERREIINTLDKIINLAPLKDEKKIAMDGAITAEESESAPLSNISNTESTNESQISEENCSSVNETVQTETVQKTESELNNTEPKTISSSKVLEQETVTFSSTIADSATVANESILSSKYDSADSESADNEGVTIKDEKIPTDIDLTWEAYVAEMKALQQKIINEVGWPNFDDVFVISALDGDGVEDLREYLFDLCYPGDWADSAVVVSGSNVLDQARQCVYEQCLQFFPKEMPYKLDISVADWEQNEGYIFIHVHIRCHLQRHLKYFWTKVLDPEEQVFKSRYDLIKQEARKSLMNSLRTEVAFALTVMS